MPPSAVEVQAVFDALKARGLSVSRDSIRAALTRGVSASAIVNAAASAGGSTAAGRAIEGLGAATATPTATPGVSSRPQGGGETRVPAATLAEQLRAIGGPLAAFATKYVEAFKQTPKGKEATSRGEAAAMLAMLRAAGYTYAGRNEAGQVIAQDPETGERYIVTADTDGLIVHGDANFDKKVDKGITDGQAAQIALGYAQLAAANENARLDRAQRKDEFDKNYQTGIDQFDRTFDRAVFTSDRTYEQARDQFAETFAENIRQFDIREAGTQSRFELGEAGTQSRFEQGEAGTQSRFEAGLQSDIDQFNTRLSFEGENQRGQLIMQAARLAAEQSVADRQANIAESEQRANRLTRPSDFLARVFESRGETSPLARVSHADLINELNEGSRLAQAERDAATATARGLVSDFRMPTRLSAPVFQQPVVKQPVTAPVVTPPEAPSAGTPRINPAANVGDVDGRGLTTEQLNAMIRAQSPAGTAGAAVPRLAEGGTVGGSAATPQNKMPRLMKTAMSLYVDAAEATGREVDPAEALHMVGRMVMGDEQEQPKAEDMAVVGDDPSGQPSGFEETVINDPRNPFPATVVPGDVTRSGGGVPRMAGGGTIGGGIYGARGDLTGTITQDELESAARTFAPPGVRDTVSGARPAPFQAAQPNLSPRRVGALTPSEQTALNTYLGVVNNTTLEDELAGMSSTFGPVVTQRRARLVTS